MNPNREILNQKLPKYIVTSESKCVCIFLCFYCTQFESFLLPLQAGEPVIHQLFPFMCKLLNDNQDLSKKKTPSDLDSNIYIDISKKENLKNPLSLIDIGAKAKLMFTNLTFFPDEKQTKFRKDCLKFYVTAVQHLQSKLSLDIPLVKHAQFLHPEKQLPSAASVIFNLALSICSVHKTCLQDVFLNKSLVTHEKVCDMVRTQWFQNEMVPKCNNTGRIV